MTPSTLFSNPVGACDLVRQVVGHPLWAGYLLPSVLGMVTRITYKNSDPLVMLER